MKQFILKIAILTVLPSLSFAQAEFIEGDYTLPAKKQQHNTASINKTLITSIILQLEKEGKLNTTDKAVKYLADDPNIRFEKINYFTEISIGMLLNHTSGIADVFTDTEIKFNINFFFHRKRKYTPQILIDKFYKYKLNEKFFKKPGEGYHYSDINYIMLGSIIEKITHQSMPEAIKEHVLQSLKMENICFNHYRLINRNDQYAGSYLDCTYLAKNINFSYERRRATWFQPQKNFFYLQKYYST